MLQLNNQTPFLASLAVFSNEHGIECAYAVAKGTFQIGSATAELAEKQQPIVQVDEYFGDPTKSSLKAASELTLAKPGTDILLVGSAYAPGGRAVTSGVSLRVGSMEKTVRVFGRRVWRLAVFGAKMSDPEPFEKIPLQYEFAFGGTDAKPRDPNKVDYEPRNPVGKGLVPRLNDIANEPELPNIEDARELIRKPTDRPRPAGFGPICPHWEPRRAYAGTYDAAWTKKRAPFLPKDFDPRFFQTAPPELVSTPYLQGGEPVTISGATPGDPLFFHLPQCTIDVRFRFDSKEQSYVANLDTVTFEPDQKRVTMVWRAVQVVDKHLLRLREIEINCPQVQKRKAG